MNKLWRKMTGDEDDRRRLLIILVIIILGAAYVVVSRLGEQESPILSVASDPIPEGMKTETTADSRLYFDQTALTVKAGETFTVIAMVDPGENRVSGADIEVSYDSKKLRLEKIAPSETFSLELAKAKIDNVKGAGAIALGVPLESASVAEPTAIASYTFRALSSVGSAMAAFSGSTIVAADNEPGNVVKEKVPVTITLGTGR